MPEITLLRVTTSKGKMVHGFQLEDSAVIICNLRHNRGRLSYDWTTKPENMPFRTQIKKAKARALVISVKKGTTRYYDLTDLGGEVLNTLNTAEQSESA